MTETALKYVIYSRKIKTFCNDITNNLQCEYNENNYSIYCLGKNKLRIENSAQDRSPFCIFHVMNEIWLHLELIDKFSVRSPCPNFAKDQIKSGNKMALYPAM